MPLSLRLWCLGICVPLVLGLSACAAKKPVRGPGGEPTAYESTPVPTVPPAAPTPEATPAPIPTRPVGTDIKPTKDRPIGPVVTFLGAARADGTTVEPIRVDKGIPVYRSAVGSGFMLVVEVKPGAGGREPGRSVFKYDPSDPQARPDLEIQTTRNIGDGSRAVCDKRRPTIGGVPGISPPNFAESRAVSDTINDLSCRFETFIETQMSCTMNRNGDYRFVNPDTTLQFCMIVARAWAFPVGRTLVSVRVRDTDGNPGPVKQVWIENPGSEAKPAVPKKGK